MAQCRNLQKLPQVHFLTQNTEFSSSLKGVGKSEFGAG